MKYSYFPGCTLKNKAVELDESAKKCAKALGAELEEIDEWQCCGGVYTTAKDEIATKLASVRALAKTREKNQKLVTICSACHNVLKRVNDDMRNNEYVRTRVNNYNAQEGKEPYGGETEVIHYLELLRDEIGFENIKKAVVNPINLKVGDSIFIYSYSYKDKVVTITDINELKLTVNEELRVDEPVSIGLIQYPNDIKMGVVNLIKWDISNREKVGVKSETISRWSVTYFDLENNSLLGYPASLLGFLKPYKKMRC